MQFELSLVNSNEINLKVTAFQTIGMFLSLSS